MLNVPVISFIEDEAVSCGYWLACTGQQIYACRNSNIGAIGVIYSRPWVENWQHELIEKKLNLDEATEDKSKLASCPNKTTSYPTVAMKKDDLRIIQESLEDDHKIFVELVKSSRGERLKHHHDEEMFSGRFWTAERAEKLGLIDGIDNVESYIRRRWGDQVEVKRWYHQQPQ